jgi:hypothetical protein
MPKRTGDRSYRDVDDGLDEELGLLELTGLGTWSQRSRPRR